MGKNNTFSSSCLISNFSMQKIEKLRITVHWATAWKTWKSLIIGDWSFNNFHVKTEATKISTQFLLSKVLCSCSSGKMFTILRMKSVHLEWYLGFCRLYEVSFESLLFDWIFWDDKLIISGHRKQRLNERGKSVTKSTQIMTTTWWLNYRLPVSWMMMINFTTLSPPSFNPNCNYKRIPSHFYMSTPWRLNMRKLHDHHLSIHFFNI